MDIQKQIQHLYFSIDNYPHSSKSSLLKYDVQTLFETLSKKEEKELLPNDDLRRKALIISLNYGNLAGQINDNPKDMNIIYNTMVGLDNEIVDNLDGFYQLYAIQWGLSVKALWYYRNNDFEEAVKLTQQCIGIIDELINNGMYCLIFRNVEQNKNLAFVSRKRFKIKSSDMINGDILRYYFSGKSNLLIGFCFQNKNLWNEMPYLRESFGYIHFREQVEVYYNLLKSNLNNAKKFYATVFKKLREYSIDTLERHIMFGWIEIQDSYYNKEYSFFFSAIDAFFQDKKEVFYDIFKKVIIYQLIQITDQIEMHIDKNSLIKKLEYFEESKLSNTKIENINGETRKAKIE